MRAELVLDLVGADGLDVVMIVHGMSEIDVRTVLVTIAPCSGRTAG